MERIGEIIEINGDIALVRIKRVSSCGENCASCKGCASTTTKVSAVNRARASEGDLVKLEMNTGAFIFLAAIGYLLPIILSIAAYLLVMAITDDVAAADAAFVSVLLLTFFVFFLLDKKISKSRIFASVITKIIGKH